MQMYLCVDWRWPNPQLKTWVFCWHGGVTCRHVPRSLQDLGRVQSGHFELCVREKHYLPGRGSVGAGCIWGNGLNPWGLQDEPFILLNSKCHTTDLRMTLLLLRVFGWNSLVVDACQPLLQVSVINFLLVDWVVKLIAFGSLSRPKDVKEQLRSAQEVLALVCCIWPGLGWERQRKSWFPRLGNTCPVTILCRFASCCHGSSNSRISLHRSGQRRTFSRWNSSHHWDAWVITADRSGPELIWSTKSNSRIFGFP